MTYNTMFNADYYLYLISQNADLIAAAEEDGDDDYDPTEF